MKGFTAAVRRERASAKVAELARGRNTTGTHKTYLPNQRKFLKYVLAHYMEDHGIRRPSANRHLLQLLGYPTEEIMPTIYKGLVDADGAGSTFPKTVRSNVFNHFSDTGVMMPKFMRSVLIKNMF
ncbi:hypothetical protein FVE85_4365 [Porphyridium purpureum]|uniref:Uncharacterized protein n=1 Tax=Porphyridium purpureum TaxID=35688 RepID=A0A5J4YIX5_PORPP|nr:hypothetical protein FVE85_4365 [Porphyridium purpureum]|eukprot:POR3109..scf270_19